MRRILIILLCALSINAAVVRVNGNGGRGFTTTQNGTAGNEYQGAYGLQKALDSIDAGDTIAVYTSTALMLDNVALITIGTDKTATWLVGDSVQNNTGAGDDWTGIICEITATTLLVECRTGNYTAIDIADGVQNVTRSDIVTSSAKSTPGLEVASVSGSTTAYITLAGANSSYVIGTQATLDGNDIVTNVATFNACNYWNVKNVTFTNGTANSIRGFTGNCDYWYVTNCIASSSGQSGFEFSINRYAIMRFCVAQTNGYVGFNMSSGQLLFCKSLSNSREGAYITTAGFTVLGCIFANNTRANFRVFSGANVRLYNSIVHGSGATYAGVQVDAGVNGFICLGNRITSNGTYGISVSAANLTCFEDYNYFQTNGSGSRLNMSTGLNSVDGTDTDYGYQDYTNGNFSLASSATNRNISINLNW